MRWMVKCGSLMPLAFVMLLLACATSTNPTNQTSTTTAVVNPTLIANLQPYSDATGTVATYSSAGSIDPSGVFFQSLGTNGRTCATCHQLSQGLSLTPVSIQALFTSSAGTDPLFNAIDGANCPTAANADQSARSLLLNNGLIRIPITLPATAQFSITVVQDPYGCAIALSPATGAQIVSVYRRPLPVASLPYMSSIMWDARETSAALTNANTFSANLATDLDQQALDAVATHEQGSATPTTAQTSAILNFIQGLYTAQMTDTQAGSLLANGARGGAANLAAETYYPGIKDAFGGDPTGAPFNPQVFRLYATWANSSNAAQASIANGENLFNTAPMGIANVRGINDNPALGSPAVLPGSCSTCHDAPNLGHHSVPLPLDTAVARLTQFETDPGVVGGLGQLSAPSLPTYKITGCTNLAGQPVTYYTSDPGKGLVTGLCVDVNRMKVPLLRGLAARAPYFHNGSASNLAEVVAFYNARFNMRLNPQQQQDLVHFLNAL